MKNKTKKRIKKTSSEEFTEAVYKFWDEPVKNPIRTKSLDKLYKK